LLFGLVLVLALGGAGAGLRAAEPAPAGPSAAGQPQTLSSDDLKSLVKTLENDAERQKFIAQLKSLIAAREATGAPPPGTAGNAGTGLLSRLSEAVASSTAALTNAAAALFDLPGLIGWVERQANDPAARGQWIETFVKLAFTLALAALGGRLASAALGNARRALDARGSGNAWLGAAILLARIIVDLVPIAVFAALAYAVLPFTKPSLYARLLTLVIVNASVAVRAFLTLARNLLTPPAAAQHLFAMSEETASYWLVWLRRLAGLSIYGYFATEAALLLGLPRAGYEAIGRAIGLAVAALVIVLVLQNRHAAARRIRGARQGEGEGNALQLLRARLADIWHVLAILYVGAVYVVWALSVSGGFEFILRASLLSLFVLVLARILAGGGESLLRRFFAIGDDLKRRFPTLEARADRYLPILVQLLRALVWLAALLALLEVWGLASFDWLSSDFGRRVLGSLASVALTVIVALAVWEAISLTMEAYLARRAAEGSETYRRARAHTLLPLLHKTLSILIAGIAALIALSALGISIAPLLAGVGVAGLAVGFGAQSLVKDLITGVFIVIEDTIAVGDKVTLAGDTGEVEAISLRSLRLRDETGGVHTIPFSEVSKILNMTKDFGYAVFHIGIAYRENVDRVIEVVKALGAELAADLAYASAILAPLEMEGLDRFGESAVIISARLKTRPGQQWAVTREFNRRLKRRFDELGIEMPFPTRTLFLENTKEAAGAPGLLAPEARGEP